MEAEGSSASTTSGVGNNDVSTSNNNNSNTTSTNASSSSSQPSGGACILCKCAGYEPSPTNPMRFCVCSHGRSCHPQKKTVFSSALSQAATAASNASLGSTTSNTGPLQNHLAMANKRKSARLEFWQKLEEGVPTRPLAVDAYQFGGSAAHGGDAASASTAPASGRDNYNPYRSISPGSFKKQSSRNSFYVVPTSATTTAATTAAVTSSMTSKSAPIPPSSAKNNLNGSLSHPSSSEAPSSTTTTTSTLSVAKPSTSKSEPNVSSHTKHQQQQQHEESSTGDASAEKETNGEATIGNSSERERGSTISSKPKLSQREMVLAEIFDTEQQYVDDLNLLVQNYIHPLRLLDLMAATDIQVGFVGCCCCS